MKENNVQIDLYRNGDVVAQLHMPIEHKDGKTEFQVLESILNEPNVKGVIETITGSKPDGESSPEKNNDTNERWMQAFTEDEISTVTQQLKRIEDAVTEIKKTMHIATETSELPF